MVCQAHRICTKIAPDTSESLSQKGFTLRALSVPFYFLPACYPEASAIEPDKWTSEDQRITRPRLAS
jgi:hypothetical protein